jgi:hypothetical protein
VAVLLALVGVTIVESATNNEAGQTPVNGTSLACTDLEPLWLEAQAVPSASLVPCLRSLPGWTLRKVTVNDGRSVLTLDNDRAGPGAMVARLTPRCDIRGAAEAVSEEPGVQRYLRFERLSPTFVATRFDLFPGGCLTTQLTAPEAQRSTVTGEAPLILGFTTREELRQALEQRSEGRLQLDPSEAG